MIHVERIDTGSGRHWVVTIPGTARWSPVAGRTPIDLSGDVRLLAGERSAGMTGVVAAMRAIGVRKGEPVLLAGHSQGGLIAAGLAADSSVREEFSITHVLTSGAPVASVSVPEPVQVLSIEHSDDLVPRLDGSVNRDRPNWITVSTPAPTAGLSPSDRSEPLLAHRLELYRSTAERVDRSVDPSIAFWRGGLAAWLPPPQAASGMAGGPQVPGAAWDVEISRVGRT
jgi:pimeloyl-ACP methyl ester carboxylesterase